jgi:hypothetical protein
MEYYAYILYRGLNGIEITYVTLDELKPVAVFRFEPIEIMLYTRPAKVVKKYNLIAIGQQPMGEICPNESDPTRNQNSHKGSSLTPKRYPSWHSEQAST